MDSSRLHTIVLMAMLGAILVLLVVHADAASVKPSFHMLKPADWRSSPSHETMRPWMTTAKMMM